ncbi:TPA: transporter substrate-binding domain-containing protein [Pseudomonas putida]|uniref:substrate-binding periplasmic protein n=1 Tax=Pseudomonas putida TaxID=303 RepID=UPI002363B8E1|nr:transporter substrate-binding domain-containing protein [Pseudomonas putida]MDD2008348.1 transporter substrate-binding domain-containing protein [Pseudomonas putida]HDS1775814.1 transporter substrate-binding domain-containing protein [Pseudomonas putida]
MIRSISVLRHTLICAGLLGGMLAGGSAQAAEADTWKAVKEAGVLRCGVAVSPPYTMRDARTGQYSGVFSQLCKGFGEQVLKVKVEFVDTNWDNIVAGLQSEKWDVSLALNDTPERRKAISFSEAAVGYSVTFAYNKNNPKFNGSIASFADIDKTGITVAVMSGTAQDKAISGVLKQARIVRLPGFDETRLALMSKRADMLADDSMTNRLLTTTHADWAVIFAPSPALAEQGIALGIRKQTPQADIDELNQYISEQRKSGQMDQMIQASIKESVAQSQ